MHRVAAFALGLLLVATAATTANAVECELYTTCADCTCSQFDYDLQSSCSSGCAWEVGAQRCVTAEAAQNSGVEAFYKLWKTDTQNPSTTLKEKLLEHGQTTCDIGVAPGTIVTVACFFTVATAFTLFMMCSYVRDKKKASVELDHTDWFLARVREHVPPSDTLLWSDAATKTNKKFSGGPYIALAMTMDVLLLVPSIVWLGIGLPYSIESNWEFGFYYPICFVGGFGLIGVLVSVIASCADSNAAIKRQAYALTDKHAIVLMANANKEEMDANSSVVSYAADTVSCVSLVGGKNVVFSVASGAQGGNTAVHSTPQQRAALARAGVPTGLHSVTFADLPDPMAVFRLLQERSNGYDASTQPVVGVKVRRGSGSSAGRSEPPTGTPVTAGVAPRPVVSSSGFDGMEAPMLSTNTGGAHNDKGGRGYTTINM